MLTQKPTVLNKDVYFNFCVALAHFTKMKDKQNNLKANSQMVNFILSTGKQLSLTQYPELIYEQVNFLHPVRGI